MTSLRSIPASAAGELDVAVIGGGHNALVSAALLARAGLQVAVIERRPHAGGFAAPVQAPQSPEGPTATWPEVTEAANDFGLLRQGLIEELDLKGHGLRLEPRSALAGLVHNGVAHGVLWADRAQLLAQLAPTQRQIAMDFLDSLAARLDGLDAVLGRDASPATYGDLMRSPELVRLLSSSAWEIASQAFGDSAQAVALASAACAWTTSAPSELGTGLLLLLQLRGGPAWRRSVRPAVCASGLAPSLTAAVRAAGGAVHTDAQVVGIAVRDGRAAGVMVEQSGDRLFVGARAVLSGVDARQTLLHLVGAQHLRVDEVRAARAVRYCGGVARFVFETSAAPEVSPKFSKLVQELPGVRLFPHRSLDEVERPLDALRLGEAGELPWLEVVLQPAVTLPGGKEVAAARVVVHAHGVPAHGAEESAMAALPKIERQLRLHLGVESLRERGEWRRHAAVWQDTLGATAGDGFQGAMRLEQLFALRPLAYLGAARTSGPSSLTMPHRDGWPTSIRGLDFCGAAAHPGGYITGGPGELAARRTIAALEDGL